MGQLGEAVEAGGEEEDILGKLLDLGRADYRDLLRGLKPEDLADGIQDLESYSELGGYDVDPELFHDMSEIPQISRGIRIVEVMREQKQCREESVAAIDALNQRGWWTLNKVLVQLKIDVTEENITALQNLLQSLLAHSEQEIIISDQSYAPSELFEFSQSGRKTTGHVNPIARFFLKEKLEEVFGSLNAEKKGALKEELSFARAPELPIEKKHWKTLSKAVQALGKPVIVENTGQLKALVGKLLRTPNKAIKIGDESYAPEDLFGFFAGQRYDTYYINPIAFPFLKEELGWVRAPKLPIEKKHWKALSRAVKALGRVSTVENMGQLEALVGKLLSTPDKAIKIGEKSYAPEDLFGFFAGKRYDTYYINPIAFPFLKEELGWVRAPELPIEKKHWKPLNVAAYKIGKPGAKGSRELEALVKELLNTPHEKIKILGKSYAPEDLFDCFQVGSRAAIYYINPIAFPFLRKMFESPQRPPGGRNLWMLLEEAVTALGREVNADNVNAMQAAVEELLSNSDLKIGGKPYKPEELYGYFRSSKQEGDFIKKIALPSLQQQLGWVPDLPQDKKDWLAPSSILKHLGKSQDPENLDKVRGILSEWLRFPEQKIKINGELYKHKQLVGLFQHRSPPTYYASPLLLPLIGEKLGVAPLLPEDKQHWPALSDVLVALGKSVDKKNMNALKGVVEPLLDSPDQAIDIGEKRYKAEELFGVFRVDARTACHVNPEAYPFLRETLNWPLKLPKGKESWTPLSKTVNKLGKISNEENIRVLKALLESLLRTPDKEIKIGEKSYAPEGLFGFFQVDGPPTYYVNPEAYSFLKKELGWMRAPELPEEKKHWPTLTKAVLEMGKRNSKENISALKGKVELLLNNPDQEIKIGEKYYVPKDLFGYFSGEKRGAYHINPIAFPFFQKELGWVPKKPHQENSAPEAIAPSKNEPPQAIDLPPLGMVDRAGAFEGITAGGVDSQHSQDTGKEAPSKVVIGDGVEMQGNLRQRARAL